MSLLGIDVGTTRCKASAFSLEGRCLASASREYPTVIPKPGWAEIDSQVVLDDLWQVIAEVAQHTKADPITALCVSSMGETVTPIDASGQILDRCILSSDIRGEEYANQLEETMGLDAFYRINPNFPGSNYSMPKMRWLQDNRPDVFNKTHKFLLMGDLVMYMLGCEPTTSTSHANRTLLFDIVKEDWSDELLAATGISRQMLPRVLPGGAIAGEVSDLMADRLGLPHGVKVVVGGHDQCCCSLGAGITSGGRSVTGIGTYECITPTYQGLPDMKQMMQLGLNIEHHTLPGLYVSFIYNQGGALMRWFRDTFAPELAANGVDVYGELGKKVPSEPTDLMVLPYFDVTPYPHFVPDAEGAIVGLKMNTTREEIMKAVMEGETYWFAERMQPLFDTGMDTTEFVANGGGANNDVWMQLKADIMGVPFVRLQNTEAGTLGAAMLAGLGSGVFTDAAQLAEMWVKRGRVFEPDSRRHEIYKQRATKYRHLVKVLVPEN